MPEALNYVERPQAINILELKYWCCHMKQQICVHMGFLKRVHFVRFWAINAVVGFVAFSKEIQEKAQCSAVHSDYRTVSPY
jgi:hypothetical protein